MAEQWTHLINLIIYLLVAIPLIGLGLVVFVFTTPYAEFKLIKEGASSAEPLKKDAAKAAAHDLGGKVLGLSVVLTSAIYHSVTLFDMLLWGVVGILFQVAVFYAFEYLTPFSIRKEIPQGNLAVGIFSSRLSLAAGLILAALIS